VFDVSNRPFRGIAAVTADWESFLAEMRVIDLKFRDLEVTVGPRGDFAYATFIERAALTPRHGSPVVVDHLRTTQIYEKRRGQWLIVHEHKSKSRTE
jgi:ketosteroid isomerase-like protein